MVHDFRNICLAIIISETLAEARSKVRDSKQYAVVVVGAEFIGGVKAEGVSAMLHQHAISDWGVDTIDEKVMKAHAPKESSKSKSNICRRVGL